MIALVTGGGRGIGRAIALRLAAEGWTTGIAARSQDQLDETTRTAGGGISAFAADLSDPASVTSMIRRAESEIGPIDLLVNNAGEAGPLGAFWENDPEGWWRCLEVNLRAPMLCCRLVMPGMLARQSGRIINMVSGAGCQAYPGMSAYVASKTALIRFSEQLAVEGRGQGVSVFPVQPGLVRTAMVEESRSKLPFLQKMLDDGLEVEPEVVADLIVALASGKADSLSGRLFSARENPEETVGRGDEVREQDLYLLRLRRL